MSDVLKVSSREQYLIGRKISRGQNSDDCWLWTGAKETAGYGSFNFRGKTIRASRLSFLIFRGQIPDGLQVCHKCNVKLCVNPNHLFLGTSGQNLQHAYDTGIKAVGEKHVQAKLTAEDVLKAKELRASGHTTEKIAVMFGVSQPYISRLTRGLRRTHG